MKKKHNQGFSLVELILAMAILAIIMIAIGGFLNSTTRMYNRTQNDITVQQTSQELYDLISDKVMQAKEIRVGRGGVEYAILGTNLSTQEEADGQLMLSNGTPPFTSHPGATLYSFNALTEEDTSIDYICIYYDTAVGTKYGPTIDIFYFKDNNVYLMRSTGGMRGNSTYNNTLSDEPKLTLNADDSRTAIDDWMNACIGSTSALTDLEDFLICEDVKGFYIHAITEENALYMKLDMEKKNAINTTEGMVTIRNSYVLAPKDDPSDEQIEREERANYVKE